MERHLDEVRQVVSPVGAIFDRFQQKSHDRKHAIHIFGLGLRPKALEVPLHALGIRCPLRAECAVPQAGVMCGEVAYQRELMEPVS